MLNSMQSAVSGSRMGGGMVMSGKGISGTKDTPSNKFSSTLARLTRDFSSSTLSNVASSSNGSSNLSAGTTSGHLDSPGPPTTFHLPPSIERVEHISPLLWTWLQTRDFDTLIRDPKTGRWTPGLGLYPAGEMDAIRLITKAGERVEGMPKFEPEVVTQAAAAVASAAKHSAPAAEGMVGRVYIQVAEIRIKSKMNVQKLTLGMKAEGQETFSSSITMEKEFSRGLGLASYPAEAYLFDISPSGGDIQINVDVLSNGAFIAGSPSMVSLTSAAEPNIFRRSSMNIVNAIRRSPSILGFGGKANISVSSDIHANNLVGQAQFSIPRPGSAISPTENPFSHGKVMLAIPIIHAGIVEVGRLHVLVGTLYDTPYIPPPIMPERDSFVCYVDFQINTKRASVWRKYWIKCQVGVMTVYESEHKDERSSLGTIPLYLVASLVIAPETLFVRNGIELDFKPDHLLKPHERQDSTSSTDILWRMGVSERKGEMMVIYLALPSKEMLEGFLDEVKFSQSCHQGVEPRYVSPLAVLPENVPVSNASARKLPEPPQPAVRSTSAIRVMPSLQVNRPLPHRRDIGGSGGK